MIKINEKNPIFGQKYIICQCVLTGPIFVVNALGILDAVEAIKFKTCQHPTKNVKGQIKPSSRVGCDNYVKICQYVCH